MSLAASEQQGAAMKAVSRGNGIGGVVTARRPNLCGREV
jgi:hypothetical protein